MATFEKLNAFTKKVVDLADVPSESMTPADIKAWFDSSPEELRTTLNSIVDALNSNAANWTVRTENHPGTWQGLTPPQIGAGDMNASRVDKLEKKTAMYINVMEFGAKGDGVTDDTTTIQTIINDANGIPVYLPKGKTFVVSTLTLPSNFHLHIDGTLLKKSGTTGAVLKNNDQVTGNTNITISGEGTIDGNKSNQTTLTDQVGLIDIDNCDYFTFSVREVKGNYFPNATVSSQTTGLIYVKNSDYVTVKDVKVSDYGREAIWLKNCIHSKVLYCLTFGGVDSWSGFQVAGSKNLVHGCHSYDAGASGFSLDSTYSRMSDCLSMNNKYSNGFNFGHAGIPSDFSVVVNCVHIIDNATITTGDNGFSVVSASVGVRLSNCISNGAKKNGFNVSDGATNVSLNNCKSLNASNYGLNIFDAKVLVNNSDFRGNILGAFLSGGTSTWDFSNVRLSDDPLFTSLSIAGLGVGGTVTVTNGNITSGSKVSLSPSNLAGYDAGAFISSISNGSFVITTKNSGAGGAFTRYLIS
jgi:Pectate lyase superfamily protein